MISTIRNKKFFLSFGRKAAAAVLAAAFWIFIWQAVCSAVNEEILVPSPEKVLLRLLQLSQTAVFWITVADSMLRIVGGFLIGILAGIFISALTTESRLCRHLFSPVISTVKATPVASFIILAMVWMHAQFVPVFTASLIVMPIVWANVSEGIRKTDQNLLEMGRMFRFSKSSTLKNILIPSIMPYLLAACTTGLGLAWKAGVAAEVLSTVPLSIGGQIHDAKIYIETPDLFAWTAVVILLSVVLENGMLHIMRRAGKKFNFGG